MDSILLYEILSLFFIYSFIGWCAEVSYHALVTGTFVNRGFLNGPFCPIYGIGVLGVIFLLEPVKQNLFLLFLCALLLTSFLEFLTGFILEKLFHARWWDYTDEPFHLGPYVCLKFSLIWGFACVFILEILHPSILLLNSLLPNILGKILLALLTAAMAADLYVTIATVTHIFRRLERLDKLAAEIQLISDRIGERISDSTLEVLQKQQQGRERISEYKEYWDKRLEGPKEQLIQRLEDYKLEFQQKLSENSLGHRRIIKAFPHLHPRKHRKVLDALRQVINHRKQ